MKTVFVLGAGSSKPFGFPLGPELKTIITEASGRHDTQNRLHGLKHTKEHLLDLSDRLAHSRFQTIDEFLEARKSFREIGGQIIAEAILTRENKSFIFPTKDWHKAFYNKIYNRIINKEKFDISFISLNYDRSLEFFLEMVPRYDCREEEEERITEGLKAIKIFHPHGHLGTLSELHYGKFNQSPTSEILKTAASNIQIISDKLEDSESYKISKSVLGSAEKIIFIGFAYHPTTVVSLLSEVDPTKTKLIGTSLKLSQDRATHMQKWAKNHMVFYDVNGLELVSSAQF